MKNVLKPQSFMKQSELEQTYTTVWIIANFHHVICVSLGLYDAIFMCDYPFAFLAADEKCMRTYKPIYSKGAILTVGYHTYDTLIILFATQSCFRPGPGK